MRRLLIILVVLVVAVAGGLLVYRSVTSRALQPEQPREEVTARRGTLVSLVNATGTILPESQTRLAFQATGRVKAVPVVEGQAVKAGDTLAQLDTADLELSVAEAELALQLAQAQLLRAQRPPTDADLAAARAGVASARAAYERLLAGPTKDEIKVARANLDQAQAARDQAQMAYDRVADRPDVAMLPQALQLQQATLAYQSALASFNLTQRKPSAAELAASKSAIAQAEAAQARLEAGLTEEDLLIAQLQVQQAQLRLEQARRLLANTTLTAPHDGIITAVGIQEGELAGVQGQPAFVLTDLGKYHVQVMLDEIDVGRVSPGQAVTVTLDALPAEVLTGHVQDIAQTATLDTGVVTYLTTLELDPTSAPLRAGMTANVDIVTDRRDNILLVPNRFIRFDRLTGKTFVDRLSGGVVQSIEIEIGTRDEFSSEVLAGLEEGDVVVLVKQSSSDQLRQTFMGGAGGPGQ
jgi:HlyD family secretion protein